MCIPILSMAQINFTDLTIDQAIELAKKEDKMIFVDLSATWCGPCKVMKRTTFQDANVGEFFNEKFINLFIECDIDKQSAEIMKERYKYNAFPTLLFLDKNGVMFHKIVGSMEVEQFLPNVKGALEGKNLVNYMKRYEQGENSTEFILELINVAENAYDEELVAKLSSQYLKKLSAQQLTEERNWEMLRNNITDIDNEVVQKFMQNIDDFVSVHGKTEVDSYVNILWTRKAHSFANSKTKAFDKEGYKNFLKRLDKSNFKGAENIKLQSALHNSKVVGDWAEYLKLVNEKIKTNLEIGSLYNLAVPFEKECSDKVLRAKFSKVIEMELDKAIKNKSFEKYTELEKQYGKIYDYENKLKTIIDNLTDTVH